MTRYNKFDVIIVGAGPAGASTAISLRNSGLSVALLDKAKFPRDKICGDALSVDVINQLEVLSPILSSQFEHFHSKASSYGVNIFSPNGNHVPIPFIYKGAESCGYICRRVDFDNLLVGHLSSIGNVTLLQECEVTFLEQTGDGINLQTTKGNFTAAVIVGADGAHSIVTKKLQKLRPDKNHYSAGLRVYYEGIQPAHQENFIELHFFRDILPGYLWIFPLPENKFNVGIGMLSMDVSKKKLNLKEVLNEYISGDARLKERFRSARALESVKGFGLPLGSKQRQLSGDRFLLTGDAASLIDPFTGEGIANAIRSGRVAAAHIIKTFQEKKFSASFNLQYDREIYRRMWNELKLSRSLQKLCRYPSLFNFIVKKANSNPHVHQYLIESLANIEKKKYLTRPGFYYRMLFGV